MPRIIPWLKVCPRVAHMGDVAGLVYPTAWAGKVYRESGSIDFLIFYAVPHDWTSCGIGREKIDLVN